MDISFIYPTSLFLLLLIPLTIALALAGPRRPNKQRFRLGLILRSFLLLGLILAIAGIQIHLQTDILSTIFLLDVSDSISVQHRQQGENLISRSIQEMPAKDRAGVILFGKDALVDRLVTEGSSLSELTSVPISTQTNIAEALQLALALFPNEGAKRIILISDGQENLGYALKQAELVAANQAELLYFPIQGGDNDLEVILDRLISPSDVQPGEQFNLEIFVHAGKSIPAVLNIFSDGKILESLDVNLLPGENLFTYTITADEPGFHRYRVQIIPDSDFRLQNNEQSTFVKVSGPPNILIVEGKQGEGNNLADALIANKYLIEIIPSRGGLNADLQEMSSYDTIIFVNVPATDLSPGLMDSLQVYVRDLGKGFIMIGGENTFGAGGYIRSTLEEILPVNMDVKSKELTANLALVLAIDKSGSMGRCHCDDPDLNQSYTRQEVGQPKVDIAKEAVMRSASALGPDDYLGVVAFDESAKWALQTEQLATYSDIENAIGGITAQGQTNVWSGVEEAYKALQTIDAKRKHIILLTDGWTHTGDVTPLVEELSSEGITLSIIAAGGGSAEYLETLSEIGKGRYYPAEDILSVPDLFLKETVQSVGEYIIEEAFYPLPSNPGAALDGIDSLDLPPLLGYNGTTPKTAARLDLITPKGDPLLATWQYGLGRSAAWTSDLKGKWGQSWVEWESFPKFASQLAGWVLPEQKSEYLNSSVIFDGSQATISLSAQNETNQPWNDLQVSAQIVNPELETMEMTLEQTGPGKYEGNFEIDQTGTYMIRVGANDDDLQSLGQQTLGLVVPYSPEYRVTETDLAKLLQLAEITGGGELISPEEAFIHNLPSASFAVEIWRQILLIVALLFPLDVAIRRLIFDRQDLDDVRQWIKNKFTRTSKKRVLDEPKVLENLFRARDRARQRDNDESSIDSDILSELEKRRTKMPEKLDQDYNSDDQDTLSRLRKAKKRARKNKEDETEEE